MMTNEDLISRAAAIDAIEEMQMPIMRSMFPEEQFVFKGMSEALQAIKDLPSAQPEYEPVKAEDFARTMSKNTIYGFMAWHGEALELMERQGFVICKKTM